MSDDITPNTSVRTANGHCVAGEGTLFLYLLLHFGQLVKRLVLFDYVVDLKINTIYRYLIALVVQMRKVMYNKKKTKKQINLGIEVDLDVTAGCADLAGIHLLGESQGIQCFVEIARSRRNIHKHQGFRVAAQRILQQECEL